MPLARGPKGTSRRERLSEATGVPVVVLELLGVAGDALPSSALAIVKSHVAGTATQTSCAMWKRAMALEGRERARFMLNAIEATARADKAEAA